MCQKCLETMREQYSEALPQAMSFLDAHDIAEDSVLRGFARVQIACNVNPHLDTLLKEMYPTPEQLTS